MRTTYLDDLPLLDPVIATQVTETGWRGLTAQGEVLNVQSANGHKVTIPSELTIMIAGKPVGRRAVTDEHQCDIDEYLRLFNRTVELYHDNDIERALETVTAAVAVAPTLRANFNHAMILLAAGRWREGLELYEICEREAPFMRPPVKEALEAGLTPWRGESLAGKRLLVLHAHGFGDTIMTLRYVPMLKYMGAEVVMSMPPELWRLAAPCGQVSANSLKLIEADYFCPILHLLHWLNVTPQDIGVSNTLPYLNTNPYLVERWQKNKRITGSSRRRIGIAWSIGKPSQADYPRPIPLAELVIRYGNADLYSMQTQESEAARALGVHTFHFEDFADCAAAMMCMDEIVSVDTAALHLAGAIGHPKVTGLLSYWASWRWLAPWYNITLRRQSKPGDWASALC